jgi:hypothetical protein
MMTSPMGSAAVGSTGPEHQYYTRQQANRPKLGEISINGAGSTSSSTSQQQHNSTQQQQGQLMWGTLTTPTPPACSTAKAT